MTLTVMAARYGSTWRVVSFTVYGSTLLLPFSPRRLSHHSAATRAPLDARLRPFGHLSVYCRDVHAVSAGDDAQHDRPGAADCGLDAGVFGIAFKIAVYRPISQA